MSEKNPPGTEIPAKTLRFRVFQAASDSTRSLPVRRSESRVQERAGARRIVFYTTLDFFAAACGYGLGSRQHVQLGKIFIAPVPYTPGVQEEFMKDKQKYRGCLIGGAAGDALGYPVEFLQKQQILERFGQTGITDFVFVNGVAQISDDTQMTLFTAEGLLSGLRESGPGVSRSDFLNHIARSYRAWLSTQSPDSPEASAEGACWLVRVPELRHARAPGVTCMKSLRSGRLGSISQPINSSKGCGGLMRVAPIGLCLGGVRSSDEVDLIGADTAALTHGHEMGYIPAAMFVHIINRLAHDETMHMQQAIFDAISAVKKLFPAAVYLGEFIHLIEKAIDLAGREIKDTDAIKQLGEGWVADETSAIAVYCSLKYQNDFDRAIIAAVNHSGDSDSTGSVTGNIVGTYLGVEAIPAKYIEQLEIRDVILEIADGLYDCRTINNLRGMKC